MIFKNSADKLIRQFRFSFAFGSKDNLVLSDKQFNLTVSAYGEVGASRFELKYHINEFKAAKVCRYIQSFVHLDKYCRAQPRGLYPIVSFYLHSEQMHLCRESPKGLKTTFSFVSAAILLNPAIPAFCK